MENKEELNEELKFSKVIREITNNKTYLRKLKMFCVEAHQIEFAAYLREIELKKYPETEETQNEKKTAKLLNLLFRMVELNIPEDVCWLINATLTKYNKKKGKFDIADGLDLVNKRKALFD